MDATSITTLISSVGFPIVMCLILIKYMQQENQRNDDTITKLTDTINANTKAITELVTLIKDKLGNE
jgi:hypothetical protein